MSLEILVQILSGQSFVDIYPPVFDPKQEDSDKEETVMATILHISAPMIYVLVIIFSAWLGIASGRQRRGRGINPQPVLAILAGLVTCPLLAVLMQIGRLNIPSVDVVLPLMCITLGVSFFVGLIYIWSANLVLNNAAMTSLYVLASVGGSAICLYFYFFYSQVQEILIGAAWGFLFGVLVYMVIRGGLKGLSLR